MSKKLEELQAYLHKMNQYERVVTLLYWDMRTTAPKNGFEGHTDALTHFSTEQFQMSTSEELSTLLDELAAPEEFEQLDDMWKFVVKRMKRELDRNKRIPTDVFERSVKAQAESANAWEEAKNASDYSIFAPHLKNMIEITKEIAGYTDPGKDVYDALLNQYEEGMDSATIDQIFGELKTELIPLVQSILAAKQPDDSKFAGKYDVNAQRDVQKMLLSYMGFKFETGSVGET